MCLTLVDNADGAPSVEGLEEDVDIHGWHPT